MDSLIDWITTQILFSEHHLPYASSAFYNFPFEKAAILTIDGVGECTKASINLGSGNKIKLSREMHCVLSSDQPHLDINLLSDGIL